MTKLTPKAEALNDLVNNTIDHGIVSDHLTEDITNNVFRTIREELGISEDHVDELRHAAGDSEACSRHGTAECVRDIADALSTLLELAEVKA